MIGLSNAWVEIAKISARQDDLKANEQAAERFLQGLVTSGKDMAAATHVPGGYFLQGVSAVLIEQFLSGWKNHEQALLT